MELNPGDVIDGKYEVVRLLGQGGMGTVYEGTNQRIGRRVAIKTLHAAVAQRPEMVTRFEREAQAAAKIGSAHIVDVLDLGDLPNGDRYMVMEYLDGTDLTQRMAAAGKMPPQELFPLVIQLLEGLEEAHNAGIIHRDLKPDNVYIVEDKKSGSDFVKILDFGVSKFSQLSEEEAQLTRAGAFMGTPYYMSPEQARGKGEIDARADLYTVGVIMYKGLSGRVPFDAQSFNDLLFKIVMEEPPGLGELVPGIDAGAVAIVEKVMAKNPDERYQRANDVAAALEQWLVSRGFSLNRQVSLTSSGSFTAAAAGGPVRVVNSNGLGISGDGTGGDGAMGTPVPGLEQASAVPATTLGTSIPGTAMGTPLASSHASSMAQSGGAGKFVVGAIVGLVVAAGVAAAVVMAPGESSPAAPASTSVAASSQPTAAPDLDLEDEEEEPEEESAAPDASASASATAESEAPAAPATPPAGTWVPATPQPAQPAPPPAPAPKPQGRHIDDTL